jgi:hypothetical protein
MSTHAVLSAGTCASVSQSRFVECAYSDAGVACVMRVVVTMPEGGERNEYRCVSGACSIPVYLPVSLPAAMAQSSMLLTLLFSMTSGSHELYAGVESKPIMPRRVFTPVKMADAVPALSATW